MKPEIYLQVIDENSIEKIRNKQKKEMFFASLLGPIYGIDDLLDDFQDYCAV